MSGFDVIDEAGGGGGGGGIWRQKKARSEKG